MKNNCKRNQTHKQTSKHKNMINSVYKELTVAS